MQTITPFLMFQGQAEEAITFYCSVLDDARVVSLTRYGPGEPGPEGSVAQAVFSLAGQTLMATDSVVEHAFSFTPATSLLVACDDADEVDRVFAALSDGGTVHMPLDTYPFSKRFAWLDDRFGVPWQLTVAAAEQ